MCGTQIGDPVPAEYTFDADYDIFDEREDQFEKQFRIGLDILMNPNFAFLVDDTDVHFPGVQVDTAVVCVLLIVEFHRFASFFLGKWMLAVTSLYRHK